MHFDDVRNLLEVLHTRVETGNTVLVAISRDLLDTAQRPVLRDVQT